MTHWGGCRAKKNQILIRIMNKLGNNWRVVAYCKLPCRYCVEYRKKTTEIFSLRCRFAGRYTAQVLLSTKRRKYPLFPIGPTQQGYERQTGRTG
jgi:hypothetical protein